MSVLIKKAPKTGQFTSKVSFPTFQNIRDQYMAYAERQSEEIIVWYMKVILAIPCVVMVPAIFLMAMATPNYVWFIGLCILLFFGNVVSFIAEAKSTFFVPLYHATVLLMFGIPLIFLLLQYI